MKLSNTIHYPVAPAVVLRAMTDRKFHEDKIKALGALQCEVLEDHRHDSAYRIRIRRTMRNEAPVPALLKKLVPTETTLEHTDYWNIATRAATVDIRLIGLPVTLACRIVVTPEGKGSLLTHDWDVRASVPLLGSALEKFVAADLDRLMAAEAAASAPLLGRYA